jgi:hypothetical protein
MITVIIMRGRKIAEIWSWKTIYTRRRRTGPQSPTSA